LTFTFQYYNGSSWVTIPNAVLNQIIDELNGQLELDFIIPNTSANLTFVQSNQQVQLLWGSTVVFSGLLMAYTATFTQITCTVYNNTFEVMQKRQITSAYNNAAANAVLAAICSASGMTAGSCPTTAVSIQFNSTDCYTAVQNLAALLNQNVYNTGSTVIIGVKGNQTPTAITVDTQSQVNFDRSKTGYAGVIVRGVSPTGQVIIGTAGSTGAGNNTITLTNNAVTSQASLNALAAAYLQSLAETNNGCPLEADISQTATLNSGDLVTISNGAELGLSGNYAIYRITKNLTKSTLEIVTPAGAFLALINATSSINGVVASLANASAALQTLPAGSDPNTSGMYVTLTDNYGDVASLMLGNNTLLPMPSSGFPASFLTFNSNYLTYIIPSVANQNGSAATATITPQSGSPYTAPMIGLGTYKYPFLWVDQVFCFTDFLNCLESSAITLLCPLNTGTIGSATVGSSGQFLQSQGSGYPPKWVTYTPGSWNGGTVTAATTFTSTVAIEGALSSGTYGYPVLIANGGVGGQLALENTNASYKFYLTVGDTGAFGDVLAFGTSSSLALMTLDIYGDLAISGWFSSGYLLLSQGWNGSWSGGNYAQISNDLGSFKCLMIVGNASAGGSRLVAVWDYLTVNGSQTITGSLTTTNLTMTGTTLTGTSVNAFFYCVELPTNGFVQWGSGNPYISMETKYDQYSSEWWPLRINSGNGDLGCLDVSMAFIDHINSSSGAGITFFDVLCGSGSTQQGHDTFYFQTQPGGYQNIFFDTLTSGGQLIFGYNTPNSGSNNTVQIYSGTEYRYLAFKVNWDGSCTVRNFNPAVSDAFGCGAGGSYWQGVVSYYYYGYDTSIIYADVYDDLCVIKNHKFKTIMRNGTKTDVVDVDSLPMLRGTDSDKKNFYEHGRMHGLLLGGLKQAAIKFDEQELINDRLRLQLEEANLKIIKLQLQIDQLKLNRGD